MELAHGIARADSPKRVRLRELFLQRIMTTLDMYPVTSAIALRAGLLDGELTKLGIHVATPDMLMGATALEMGHNIVTSNLRHFQRITGLGVIQH